MSKQQTKIIVIGSLNPDKECQDRVRVFGEGGYHQQSALARTDTQLDTSSQKYLLTDKISYCLDANYWKGTTFESFLSKHRRQLVIETWTQE